MQRLRLLGLGLVLVLLPISSPDRASAFAPSQGSIRAYGMLSVPGLATSPPGSTPDPAQWATWPHHSYQLTSRPAALHPQGGPCVAYRFPSDTDVQGRGPSTCTLNVTGDMYGWCDLSRAGGWGHATSTNFPNDSDSVGQWRWTGAGNTLAVTAHIVSTGLGGRLEGPMVGTITLLGGAATSSPLDPCTGPGGVQSPIPVLIELEYVLQ